MEGMAVCKWEDAWEGVARRMLVMLEVGVSEFLWSKENIYQRHAASWTSSMRALVRESRVGMLDGTEEVDVRFVVFAKKKEHKHSDVVLYEGCESR